MTSAEAEPTPEYTPYNVTDENGADGGEQTVHIPTYPQSFRNRGYFLIFNQEKFHPSTGLPDRRGSDKDVESLKRRFGQLQFTVAEPFQNLSLRELKNTLVEYSRMDQSEMQMFGLAILTHGQRD